MPAANEKELNKMKRYYRLNDRGEPVAVDSTVAWVKWFEKNDGTQQIAVTKLSDRGVVHTRISTVFLGIASGCTQDGRPLLWETAVFQKNHDVDVARRYSSRLDAIAGHHLVVAETIERIATVLGRRPAVEEEKSP